MTSCVAISCEHFDGKPYSADDQLCPECRSHEDHMAQFGPMGTPQPKIPPGWKLVSQRMCSCGREAFVLCEKADDRPHDTRYVTWEADLINGGCYHGRYTEDLVEAKASLEERFNRHEGRR